MYDLFPGITEAQNYAKKLKELDINTYIAFGRTSAYVRIPAKELKRLGFPIDKKDRKKEAQARTGLHDVCAEPMKFFKPEWLRQDLPFRKAEKFLVDDKEIYLEDFVKLVKEKSKASS